MPATTYLDELVLETRCAHEVADVPLANGTRISRSCGATDVFVAQAGRSAIDQAQAAGWLVVHWSVPYYSRDDRCPQHSGQLARGIGGEAAHVHPDLQHGSAA